MSDYPNDDDGNAIRRVAADGSDMDLPMEIDFMIDAPDAGAGAAIAGVIGGLGYRTRVVFDEGEADAPSSTVYCTKEMVLTYVAVVASQDELDRLSRPLGGRSDGWGTFGNARRS